MVAAMVGDDTAGQELTKKQSDAVGTLPEDAPVVLDAEELRLFQDTIDPFSLQLRAGEVVGLAGHAGSGITHAWR